MVPFQKGPKIPQQKWYHFKKDPNFANKNGTILEKAQNSSTKMVPFEKRPKIPQQKWYHFKKYLKFLNKNGTISEKVQISLTKMVPYSRILLGPLKPEKFSPLLS